MGGSGTSLRLITTVLEVPMYVIPNMLTGTISINGRSQAGLVVRNTFQVGTDWKPVTNLQKKHDLAGREYSKYMVKNAHSLDVNQMKSF